jgi:hypothetical protein
VTAVGAPASPRVEHAKRSFRMGRGVAQTEVIDQMGEFVGHGSCIAGVQPITYNQHHSIKAPLPQGGLAKPRGSLSWPGRRRGPLKLRGGCLRMQR